MKMKRKFIPVILAIAILLVSACSSGETQITKRIIPFLKNLPPVLTIGTDDENATTAVYKTIPYFYLDALGNIYIPDILNYKFDKYDAKGNFVTSFGRKGEGPGEHKRIPLNLAVNSKGFVFHWSFSKQRLVVYSPDGNLFKEIEIDGKSRAMYIKKLKFDYDDNLFVTCFSQDDGYSIAKLNYDDGSLKVFHKDNKRTRLTFRDIFPDFDFDRGGHVFVTDLVDYKVFKYSLDGTLVDTYQTEARKVKIEETDFAVLVNNQVIKIPNHLQIMNLLNEDSKYFPCISGINIDGNRMYLWTPYLDEKKQYIVDVYDMDFSYICSTAYYNWIGDNLAVIRNNKFYTLNLGSNDKKLKDQIGRFGVFNLPHMIQCFEINPEILEK